MRHQAAFGILLAVFLAPGRLYAQISAADLAEQPKWEEFLRKAEILRSVQFKGDQAVTSPWRLTLKRGEVVRDGLWKNAKGRMGGYLEGWNYEIAACLLDRHIGLNMVPLTIEREFRGDRGSLQLWIPETITLKKKTEEKIKVPPAEVVAWNRATYLQRAWDNLIANEDRHGNQILVTRNWRMILIDHSRSFRTSKRYTRNLIYGENGKEGTKLMSELPRAFVAGLKGLTFASIRNAVGAYLSDEEISAVLVRRDLILAEIERLIARNGENRVLY